MKRFLSVILSTIVFMLFGGNLHAADFELAIPLPLTGSEAKFGEIQKRSYEIAAAEINAKGGIKGKRLVLRFEDSQAKPETARAIVEKLIGNKQPIIVGEYTSSCAKAVAAVAEERKTPYLVVASAADEITQKNYKYVFRQNATNVHYADAVVSFMTEVVKPKTMAIIYESTNFGTSGAEDMDKQAKKLGISVLVKEKYEKGAVDFKPILSKVKAARPDIIYMVSYVMDASLLMKQIKELRIEAKLYAGGAAGFAIPEFIQNAKDAAEYVVTATLWFHKLKYPGAASYAEKYKQKYGDYPSYHGASAYSAIYVIKNALEKAKSWSTDDIRSALKATNMMTAYGPVKFEDKDGYQNQNFHETFALQVLKGNHELIWPAKYATAKYVYPIPAWRDRR
ncbi:MAG TPA: ABC transporter substrate-binding protein [Dissulfurispiraceae bacterium]|nr:ABC transporter substrate-binding protein [Dissulfurispiraceae bacterium]